MRTGRLVLLLFAVPLVAAAQPTDLPQPDLSGVEKPLAGKFETLRRAVTSKPGSDQAWGLLAMNLDVHDFKTEALPHYARAAALDPTDFRWPYYRAMCLVEIGLPGAVEDFERAAALMPGYPPLLVRHGNALLSSGEMEAAKRKYSAALGAEPAVAAHARVGLARIALAQGDEASSLDHAQKSAKLAPWHGEAHGLLAELHRRRGEREQAVREIGLAQRLPGATPLPDRHSDTLLAEGASSYWYHQRGRAALQARNYGRAARELQKAVEAAPTAEYRELLGQALLHLRRYEEARQHLLAALEMQPDFPSALLYLAWLLATSPDGQLRDGEEATRLAEQACKATGFRQPKALDALAAAHAEAGRFHRAIQIGRRAYALALRSGRRDLARQIEGRLALYAAGEPYRERPRAAVDEP